MEKALEELTKDITITDLSVFQQQTDAVQHLLIQSYLESFPDLQLSKGRVQSIDEFPKKKNFRKDATKKWLRISQNTDGFLNNQRRAHQLSSPSLLELENLLCLRNTY